MNIKFDKDPKEMLWATSTGNRDVVLLLRIGQILKIIGCRSNFDKLITDAYIKKAYYKSLHFNMTSSEALRLRELLHDLDKDIEPTLEHPRLELIINKINSLL